MPAHILPAFLICTISILFQQQKAEASTVIVSHNCQRKCGNTDIPYPFGMKKGCYLDETFQVTCNMSTGSASLASLGWEVDSLSISTHTIRRINDEVLVLQFDKLGESPNGHSFYLEDIGNHYSISNTRNKIVAMGCDFYAYLIDDKTKHFLGGCASFCNRTDIISSPSFCSGLQCCQMNLPKDLRHMTLWVETMNTLTKSWADHCGFFAIVDKDFIGNTSCKKAIGRIGYVCGQNTECIDHIQDMGYKCACINGYRGNPYLPEGCQDFDECANTKDNNCPVENLCVNTAGSYYCLPNRRRIFVVLIALGISLAGGLLILIAIGIWVWRKLKKMNDRKTKQRFFKRNGGLLLNQQIASSRGSVLPEMTLFKIEELEKATDKFSEGRVLGKGGLGTVYKGMLSDGRIVAVKKANITDESQVGQFINEVIILSQINHRHIVKLLGCCLETEVPLLVYEYVSNGTLSNHIHDNTNNSTISWENRLRIAAEIAQALAYLHSCASTAIFHRDIKSSNILLGDNYKAVVSDFGLSRSVSIDRTHLTTLVGGTFGYLDPEYFRSGQLNDKSDVYAFGVVLAEIITGQRAISSNKDDKGLALRFRSAVKEHSLFENFENVAAHEGHKEEVLAVAKLAKRCLKVNARKRPSMKEVAAELDQLRKTKELQGHQESFQDEYHTISENRYSCGIDSEAEDDQKMTKDELALLVHVEAM
ncbi:hypothetical protein DH2020_032756 [Rehmannia glutinosa]|uniref:Protein kinase domain-containing protein n=1 Tax=Rehmannia glutinosa TaxID=99300 RepID=A0ABR0VI77_REHGL